MSGLQETRIVAILETLPITIKETVMSTLDIFVEKGKKIGRVEGRVEGQIEGQKQKTEKVVRNLIKVSGLSDEQIASVAEVSVEYIAEIRVDIQGSN
jgi:predicted transposase YdaD